MRSGMGGGNKDCRSRSGYLRASKKDLGVNLSFDSGRNWASEGVWPAQLGAGLIGRDGFRPGPPPTDVRVLLVWNQHPDNGDAS